MEFPTIENFGKILFKCFYGFAIYTMSSLLVVFASRVRKPKGYLEEAFNFIVKLPVKPYLGVWMCLVGASRLHKNVRIGECILANASLKCNTMECNDYKICIK